MTTITPSLSEVHLIVKKLDVPAITNEARDRGLKFETDEHDRSYLILTEIVVYGGPTIGEFVAWFLAQTEESLEAMRA